MIVSDQPDFYKSLQSDINEILLSHTDRRTGALSPPVEDAVSYLVESDGDPFAPLHTKTGGPAYGIYPDYPPLCDLLSHFEDAGHVMTTATGRAAIDLTMNMIPAGSHIIVAPDDLYPGTRTMFEHLEDSKGLTVTYTEANWEKLQAAFQPWQSKERPGTQIIVTETETNPQFKIPDLKMIADFAKEKEIYSLADNTMMLGLISTASLGFDFVAASLTKGLGANQTVGGALAFNKDKPELFEKALSKRNYVTGAVLSPSSAKALIGHAKDFAGRLKIHGENAEAVARYLQGHLGIAKVNSPSLPNDPGYALAQRQFKGPTGVFSFELKGDGLDAHNFAQYFIDETQRIIDSRKPGVPYRPDPDNSGIHFTDSFYDSHAILNHYRRQSTKAAKLGLAETFFRFASGTGDPGRYIRGLGASLANVETARESRSTMAVVSAPEPLRS